MISLTTIDYDILGHLLLKPLPTTERIVYSRRVSKAATLDGYSSISDFGYTASDNVLTIQVNNITEAQTKRLIYLIKSYPLLRLANEDGVFVGAMQTLRVNILPIEFIFTVKQQVA